jgi:hypothetical protein
MVALEYGDKKYKRYCDVMEDLGIELDGLEFWDAEEGIETEK